MWHYLTSVLPTIHFKKAKWILETIEIGGRHLCPLQSPLFRMESKSSLRSRHYVAFQLVGNNEIIRAKRVTTPGLI
jgi:hypothetical protein